MKHINGSCGTDGDPSNYLSYYRRATVYLALGRSRTGLQDLDEVIRLKPDFTAARAQRGGVLVKLGRLEEAHIDLENVVMYCLLAVYSGRTVCCFAWLYLLWEDSMLYGIAVFFTCDTVFLMHQ